MKLKNLMEEVVIYTIDQILKGRKDMCTCERCRIDIAAIVLNNLNPKYVVTEEGELYGNLNTLDYQFDVDLVREITKAIKIVKDEPHHEKP